MSYTDRPPGTRPGRRSSSRAPCTGWKVNNAGTRWTYIGPKEGGLGAITKVVLNDKSSKTPGRVTFSVTGKKGSYGAGVGVVASLVLPAAPACFEASFHEVPPAHPSCTLGATLKCQ